MSDKKEKDLKKIEKLNLQGKYDQSIDALKSIITEYPDDIQLINMMANTSDLAGKSFLAIKYFIQSGDYYKNQNHPDKAIAIYKKILKLDAENAEAYESLGEIFLNQNNKSEASLNFRKAGQLFRDQKDISRAISNYQKAMETATENQRMRMELIELYKAENHIEEAIKEYIYFVDSFISRNDLAGARTILENIIKLDPRHVDALEKLANIHYQLGDKEQTYAAYSKVMKYRPESTEAHSRMASNIFQKFGDREIAGLMLKQLHRIQPENIDILLKLRELIPDDLEIRQALKVYYLDHGDKKKAILEIKEIANIFEKSNNHNMATKLREKAEEMLKELGVVDSAAAPPVRTREEVISLSQLSKDRSRDKVSQPVSTPPPAAQPVLKEKPAPATVDQPRTAPPAPAVVPPKPEPTKEPVIQVQPQVKPTVPAEISPPAQHVHSAAPVIEKSSDMTIEVIDESEITIEDDSDIIIADDSEVIVVDDDITTLDYVEKIDIKPEEQTPVKVVKPAPPVSIELPKQEKPAPKVSEPPKVERPVPEKTVIPPAAKVELPEKKITIPPVQEEEVTVKFPKPKMETIVERQAPIDKTPQAAVKPKPVSTAKKDTYDAVVPPPPPDEDELDSVFVDDVDIDPDTLSIKITTTKLDQYDPDKYRARILMENIPPEPPPPYIPEEEELLQHVPETELKVSPVPPQPQASAPKLPEPPAPVPPQPRVMKPAEPPVSPVVPPVQNQVPKGPQIQVPPATQASPPVEFKIIEQKPVEPPKPVIPPPAPPAQQPEIQAQNISQPVNQIPPHVKDIKPKPLAKETDIHERDTDGYQEVNIISLEQLEALQTDTPLSDVPEIRTLTGSFDRLRISDDMELPENIGEIQFSDDTQGLSVKMNAILDNMLVDNDNDIFEDDTMRFQNAMSYMEMGLYEDAIVDFEAVVSNPEYSLKVSKLLGLAYSYKQEFKLAADWYSKALALLPANSEDRAELIFTIGDEYLSGRDFITAHKYFAEVYKMNPQYPGLAEKLDSIHKRTEGS